MKIISKTAKSDIATVYIAEINGKHIEFVESVQPPLPRQKKWVLIISTLFGCPVGCKMCDAGSFYHGKLSKEAMLAQIDYLTTKYFIDRNIPIEKFKIQFARMGDPAFNPAVLDLLDELPSLYNAPGLIPSISTVAPIGAENFFVRLLEIKNQHYQNGKFQLQFSLHSTDEQLRKQIIPIKKWNFAKIAEFGEKFYTSGDRKLTLNFALEKKHNFSVHYLRKFFSPEIFAIKITPINPTFSAIKNNLESYIKTDINDDTCMLVNKLQDYGYDTLFSVGELEENKIGSNCGQYIKSCIDDSKKINGAYEYDIVDA